MPIPHELRRAISPAIWATLERFYERRLERRAHAVKPGPVYVAGMFSETHGIAASALQCADAMEALGLETHRVDLGKLSQLALLREPARTYPSGGAWIIHANAPEFVAALATIGARAFSQAFLAGYWAWELPDAPDLWKRRRSLADEIWAPSAYTAAALGGTARVVPHPILPTAALERSQARALLGLPRERFIAVTLFDFRSSFARKNPLGALKAFQQAFGGEEKTLLIIKAQHSEHAPGLARHLRDMTSAADVQLIDEIWPRQQASALVAAADVVISLHRAEGFGLTLAEAMAAGTAVIATAWSGNLDFMGPDYEGLIAATKTSVEDAQRIYRGQYWAEPDIAAAAQCLRRLRTDLGWRAKLEQTGKRLIHDRLGAEAYSKSLGSAFWAAVGR